LRLILLVNDDDCWIEQQQARRRSLPRPLHDNEASSNPFIDAAYAGVVLSVAAGS
jgi:hypothetical protein